ncbi:MAG: hypothetical protein VX950_07245 [Pseudomonadota bacterium]|nr:hypothetical protein [Pseudomonadota bacterium]
MKCMPVLFAFALLLAACGRQQAMSVNALAADPAQLHVLLVQCRQGKHGRVFCSRVEQANWYRFFSGKAGPDEYQTLADLPPIPASFDGPSVPMEASR